MVLHFVFLYFVFFYFCIFCVFVFLCFALMCFACVSACSFCVCLEQFSHTGKVARVQGPSVFKMVRHGLFVANFWQVSPNGEKPIQKQSEKFLHLRV